MQTKFVHSRLHFASMEFVYRSFRFTSAATGDDGGGNDVDRTAINCMCRTGQHFDLSAIFRGMLYLIYRLEHAFHLVLIAFYKNNEKTERERRKKLKNKQGTLGISVAGRRRTSVLNTCSARCVRSFALIFISWVHGLRQQFTRITILFIRDIYEPNRLLYIGSTSTRMHSRLPKRRSSETTQNKDIPQLSALCKHTASSVNINDSRSRVRVEKTKIETAHDTNTIAIYELMNFLLFRTHLRDGSQTICSHTDLFD